MGTATVILVMESQAMEKAVCGKVYDFTDIIRIRKSDDSHGDYSNYFFILATYEFLRILEF
jgi:hypothetical protein